jgi:hypothetical protein
MIASIQEGARLPRVAWRRTARRSLDTLLNFVDANAFGDPAARRLQIERSIESLRYAPLRCEVVETKGRLAFRRLIVGTRFFVYYVYTPPRGMTSGGTISIRAIKHAASQNPFLGVRETVAGDHPLRVLSTRDRPEPATA